MQVVIRTNQSITQFGFGLGVAGSQKMIVPKQNLFKSMTDSSVAVWHENTVPHAFEGDSQFSGGLWKKDIVPSKATLGNFLTIKL